MSSRRDHALAVAHRDGIEPAGAPDDAPSSYSPDNPYQHRLAEPDEEATPTWTTWSQPLPLPQQLSQPDLLVRLLAFRSVENQHARLPIASFSGHTQPNDFDCGVHAFRKRFFKELVTVQLLDDHRFTEKQYFALFLLCLD